MTDYQALANEMRDRHCGACKYGLAIRALQCLDEGEPIAIPTVLPSDKPTAKPKVRNYLDPAAETRTEKACNNCGVLKPVTAYPKNKTCADGHAGTCSACTKERIHRVYLAKKAKKIQAKTAPKLDGKFRCDPCHAIFNTKQALDGHNCIAQ
jgi:hypothetical protein